MEKQGETRKVPRRRSQQESDETKKWITQREGISTSEIKEQKVEKSRVFTRTEVRDSWRIGD